MLTVYSGIVVENRFVAKANEKHQQRKQQILCKGLGDQSVKQMGRKEKSGRKLGERDRGRTLSLTGK